MTKKKKMLIISGVVVVLLISIITQHVLNEMGSIPSADERNRLYGHLSYYNTETSEFVSPDEVTYFPERTTGGSSGFSRFFSKSSNAPKEQLPTVKLTKADFTAVPSSYALYWLGHSSAIIELDGLRILVDPVLQNAAPFPGIVQRYVESPIKREELPDVDVVLISHDHYDHLEARTMKYLKDRDARFIVPLGVGTRLKGWGVPQEKITEMVWGDSITLSTVRIAAVPSVHYSGRTGKDRNQTLWAAYAIKGSQKNIFWSGDTGYGEHIRKIAEKYGPFDLACIEIDGWNDGWPNTHLYPHEAVQVAHEVGAPLMLPTHWGVFDLALHPWNESIQTTVEAANDHQVRVLTPLMGQKIVPGETETKKWW